MKLSEIESNIDAGEEGVWVTMTGGWEAKVRSTQCDGYRKRQQQHLRKNRRFYAQRGTPPVEIQDSDALELVVEELLADWRGLTDDSQEPPVELTFSKEAAYQVLGDPRYKQMLDDVSDAATERETFRKRALEEDLGNSGASSTGS